MPTLLPNARQTFTGPNGAPLSGGSVYMYIPNTSTFKNTYQDVDQTILNTNPIILDANGQASIWGTGEYRQRVLDVNNNLVWDQITEDTSAGILGDYFDNQFLASLGQFTPGVTTQLTLTQGPGVQANAWIFFDGVFQEPNSWSFSGGTVTFNAAIPVGVSVVLVKVGGTVVMGIPGTGSVIDSSVSPSSKLYNRINDFYDLRDYGAKCDGITDDTAAVNSFISTIGSSAVTVIIPGPTLVSSNITLGVNTVPWFLNLGKFVGNVGTEVITVQRQIQGGPFAVFSNCAPIATTGQNVIPEWFGAARNGSTNDATAFNKAYSYLQNVGGQIRMQPGNYAIASAISAQYSHISLMGAGLETTTITSTVNNADGIDCIGTSGNIINSPVFEGFSLTCQSQTAVGAGINLNYTALAKISDVQVNGFINGFNMLKATNTFLTRAGASYSGAVTGFIGFNINGGGAVAGGNESSVFRDCYAQGSGSSGTSCIAYRAYGAYVSDLYFDNCSSAEMNYGWELDYSVAAASGYADVTLVNPVVDGFTLQGILINQVPTGQKVSVIGGWINPASTGAETDNIYITTDGGQVYVGGGIQLQGDNNHANAVGVRVVNSLNVQVDGAQFGNCNYGIKESGSGYCRYSGSFWNALADSATTYVSLTGSARSMVVNSIFQGHATLGVGADNTSTGVGVVGCTFSGDVATAVQNNSTGPVGGSDGTTGLNSGA